MGILIDSNIFIKAEKGDIDLDKYINGRENEDFFISVITASELLHGVWRATAPISGYGVRSVDCYLRSLV